MIAPMEIRPLGRTGLQVSAAGFGAWAVGGPATLGGSPMGWGPVDEKTALETLAAAIDAGVTLFDTADIYGMGLSEERLGKAIRGKRHGLVIATKVGNREDAGGAAVKDFSPAWVLPAVEKSLKRLGVDCVDLLQLHSPADTFRYTQEAAEPFEHLKKEGKIRFYGVSVGRFCQALKVMDAGFGDTLQLIYNLLDRRPEKDVLPKALAKGYGVIARVPLASGFLSGKYRPDQAFAADDWRSRWPRAEVRAKAEAAERLAPMARGRTRGQAALAFCLSHPAVSAVIPGARTPAQARENAGSFRALADEEMGLVDAIVPPDKAVEWEAAA